MTDSALTINGISKKYHLYDTPLDRLKESLHPFRKKYHREFYALRDVTLDIMKGETVGIIGKNGSGKSTLLKIVTGVLTPTSGRVAANGRVLALLELGTGFNQELTGLENVYFYGSIMGLPKGEIDQKIDAILAFADIGDFVNQPVKTYSSGMLVRLSFAVVANMDADILVIDEALAVGDAFFVQKCFRFLRKFMEHGTILFVSHDTGAVVNLCSRAVWLQDGAIRLQGSPKKVSEAYLAAYYEESQGQRIDYNHPAGVSIENDCETGNFKDMRLDFINSTNLRNDMELFSFQPGADSFGEGGAEITSVKFWDAAGNPLTWIVGGEDVSLIIRCRSNKELTNPIVGFFVKDRLGQYLFGDNTFVSYRHTPLTIKNGQSFQSQFTFRMPLLPVGDYNIDVAVSEGTQENHVQHHWLHDVLMFKSHSSSVCNGLVGIPMHSVRMTVIEH
ncbi:MAG: ABC transporter ATP-binding protein [Pseudomonadota bacterium]